ncbi:MAG: HD domain-containing protein [Syntrophomonadaceae bacterium]|nr:HD domain-containing protein [Syntrophomonadaceae bacterium]
MTKHFHEFRDPIHVFIKLDSDERKVVDSYPFQRLRNIHQLATSYLVYPGATHKRFEHSLGVMELASRVFDVITNPRNLHEKIKDLIPEITLDNKLQYWRRVLRMAALCHDLGHLPFSHAAEDDLLPEGVDHETITVELIRSEEMQQIWQSVTPPLRTDDIIKLAVGPNKTKGIVFSDWEAVLSEVIVGDAFGVDRIDYLLRDSYHAGVAYGRFDHFRLIDTLRILPKSTGEDDDSIEPALGIEEGGLHSSEALLLARYFMYSQVYFHPVRRIYDIHLKDFLMEWLPRGKFSPNANKIVEITDNEVLAAISKAANNSSKKAHESARRFVGRKHFRLLYQRHPDDTTINPEPGKTIFESATSRFGVQSIRRDNYTQKSASSDFPVLCNDGRITSSISKSSTIQRLPVASFDYVFINPEYVGEGHRWLKRNRLKILIENTNLIEEE